MSVPHRAAREDIKSNIHGFNGADQTPADSTVQTARVVASHSHDDRVLRHCIRYLRSRPGCWYYALVTLTKRSRPKRTSLKIIPQSKNEMITPARLIDPTQALEDSCREM